MELGEPDSSGRRRPVEQKGSEYTLTVDWVISAIGQEPDLTGVDNDGNGSIKVTKWKTIEAHKGTFDTDRPGRLLRRRRGHRPGRRYRRYRRRPHGRSRYR